MPKVSVIIPCFNLGKYLNESVNSVLKQTFQDFEIVVVNDGSTDYQTKLILNKLSHKKITLINTENQGPSKARNIGIHHAKGQYILPLDADDKIQETYLQKAVKILDDNQNVGIVYCKAEFFGDYEGKWDLPDFTLSKILVGNMIFCSGFFRKSDWEKVEGYKTLPFAGWEDYDFWLSIIELERDVHRIPEYLFYYRRRKDSRSSVMTEEQVIAEHKLIVNNHPKLYLNNINYVFEHIYFLNDLLDTTQKNFEQINQELTIKNDEISQINKTYNLLQEESNKLRTLIINQVKIQDELIKKQEKIIFLQDEIKHLTINNSDLKNQVLKLNELNKKLEIASTKREELILNLNNKIDLLDSTNTELKYENGDILLKLNKVNEFQEKLLNSKSWRLVNFWWNSKYKIFSWYSQKKMRVQSLHSTAKYILEKDGFNQLLNRTFSFLRGERLNTNHFLLNKVEFEISIRESQKSFQETYLNWIKENEPGKEELEEQKKNEKKLKYRPLVSILTPVFNTNAIMLKQMIDSVIEQTYSNWELCIVDGGSTKPQIQTILEGYQKLDNRIKIKYLSENLGISGNSNEGLKIVKGEFTALLDHDDTLSPNALFEVVMKLNDDKELDFVYSDRDTITEDGGERMNPFFKPQWSPEMLFNANYLTHLNVIRTNLLKETESFFDSTTDGAQDWDVFLRITSKTSKIAHLPKILYHWRVHQKSTSSGMEAKPYASIGQLNSINKHLLNKGIKAQVSVNKDNMPQINWVSNSNVSISIIILNENHSNIDSILADTELKTFYHKLEFIILSNSTKELNYSNFSNIRQIKYNPSECLGKIFQSAVNISNGEIIIFLDEDLKPYSEKLTFNIKELVNWTNFEEIATVGGMLLYSNEKIASTGLIVSAKDNIFSFGEGYNKYDATLLGHFIWYRNFSALPKNCFAIRKQLFEKVGGLNQELNDSCFIDLSLRLSEKGLRHIYNPNVVFIFENKRKIDWRLSLVEFNKLLKINSLLIKNNDPYFNSNLEFSHDLIKFKINS